MRKSILFLLLTITVLALSGQVTYTVKISYVMNKSNPPSYTFTSDLSGEALKYYWYFSDNTTSEEVSPTHTFKTTGNYKVLLKILDKEQKVHYGQLEASFTGGTTLTACRAGFTATIILPATNTASKKVAFANYSSGDIQEYAWSFGDGTTSAEKNPVHEYSAFGEYKVCLVIKTTNSCKSDYCLTVKLADPTAPVILSAKGYVKDKSSTEKCGLVIVLLDGTILVPVQIVPAFELKAGQYIELAYEVLANTSPSCQAGKPVKIHKIGEIQTDTGCKAYFTATNELWSNPAMMKKMVFANLSSGNIKECSWSFGDGKTSTEKNPGHEYGSFGEYRVCLVITTTTGCKSEYCSTVKLTDPAVTPVIYSGKGYVKDKSSIAGCGLVIVLLDGTVLLPVQVVPNFVLKDGQYVELAYELLTNTETICQAGKPVRVHRITIISNVCNFDLVFKQKDQTTNTFLFYAVSNVVIKTWKWSFGDGKESNAQNPEHSFEKSGIYVVSCTITTENGCVATRTKNLTVAEPPLPVCPGAINLLLFDPHGDITLCNGKAAVSLLDPQTKPYEKVSYSWSNGDTGDTARKLCSNKLYSVHAVIDQVCQKNTSFAFLTKPAWRVETASNKCAFIVESPIEDIIYRWDFGDGKFAYGSAVDYSYEKDGEYNVTLTAITGNYSTESTQKVAVLTNTTLAGDNNANTFKIYPNPVKDILRIEPGVLVEDDLAVEMIDMKGQMIYSGQFRLFNQRFIDLNVGHLRDGIYLLRLKSDDRVFPGVKFLKTN